MNYKISLLTGSRANGQESDRGRLFHARMINASGNPSWVALCGKQPGKRSDWSEMRGEEVTCPACKRKMVVLNFH